MKVMQGINVPIKAWVDEHVIEYTRAGTRGKDRFLVLFEKPEAS